MCLNGVEHVQEKLTIELQEKVQSQAQCIMGQMWSSLTFDLGRDWTLLRMPGIPSSMPPTRKPAWRRYETLDDTERFLAANFSRLSSKVWPGAEADQVLFDIDTETRVILKASGNRFAIFSLHRISPPLLRQ